MLLTLRDTTFVVSEIFAWRVESRYHPAPLSQLELEQGDEWITTVWMRPFHLSFSVPGHHADALEKAVREREDQCSSTSTQTVHRRSAD